MKKVAIVTGSSSGVGAATCLKLAHLGWNVAINYSKNEKGANETANACENAGAETLVLKGNVASDDSCKEMIEQTVQKWGRIDALVNNAGTTKFCNYDNLDGLSKKDFLDVYEVNVVGAYQMARAAVPYLKKSDDGVIVNTSSTSALTGIGSSMAYAASKGALTTLTKSLSQALAPNIRVNAICPGFIQGSWTQNFLGEKYEEAVADIEKTTLVQDTCLPEDLADSIVYLITQARMVTGEILRIDGGVNQMKFK
jgi:3-oxoacyl-[acyl-carrier protein] reductase